MEGILLTGVRDVNRSMNQQRKKGPKFDLELALPQARRLARHLWKHFKEDRLFEEAASLSYTSLLALVPLLAVIFGVVSIFPVFSQWSEKFKDFVFSNFVPAAGETVSQYMDTFLDSVSGLTLPGTIVLIVTALLLMFRIEVAFNKIWRVTEPRTITGRIVMYWAVLTLFPIMVGGAVVLGAQNIFSVLGLDGEFSAGVERVGIFFLMWMAFTLIFALVPNRKVKFRDSIVGAFLTTLLFEIAKSAFVAYVTNANYAVIYGALATVPIFLFWLYLVWSVVLLGASLAASLTTFEDLSRTEVEWPHRLELQLVFRLLGHLWEAQRKGKGIHVADLMEEEKQVSENQLREMLNDLRAADVVAHHPDDGWCLLRDLQELSFGELLAAGGYYLPIVEADECPRDGPWDETFCAALSTIRDRGEEALNQPLRDMFKKQ